MIKIWESLPGQIKKLYKVLVTILVIAILVENPFGSAFITSLTSQEFFLTHIKDIADYADRSEEKSDYYLATGTYENQIDGDLFGIAEGRNLIIVQMESMQSMMLESDYYGQEITPFLNSLIDEPGTFYFDNFYCQLGAGNTSDAEFVVNNSIIGSIESYTYQLYQDNYFKGLPWILKEKGYNTNVFHGYKKDFWNRENVYPVLGFDNFYGDTEFVNDNIEGIGAGNIVGISDSAFFEQIVNYMKALEEPYYSFVITLSTHNPFGLPEFLQEIELRPEEENIVGRYIQSANYSDRCLEEFFDALKEEGLYENSLIIMYGDHFGLTRADADITKVVSDWRGEAYTYDEMLRVPLFVHIPGYVGNERISISGAQWDVLPTVSYLLGIEELDTLYMG
ncbi:MAG: LTA synthase family protein, partial [Firmicutes bacterium]|nr:LTA synthase family protein [Bacillota bacterium]